MGREAESRAEDDGDACFLQQLCRESLIVLYDMAVLGLHAERAFTGRVDVEGPFRCCAIEAFRLVQHTDDQVSAFLEHLVVLVDETIIAVQGGYGSPLADGRCAGDALRL